MGQIGVKLMFQLFGNAVIVQHSADFKVEKQAARVEIGGPHQRPATVDRQCFRMQLSVLVFVDLHPGVQQRIIIGTSCSKCCPIGFWTRNENRCGNSSLGRGLER